MTLPVIIAPDGTEWTYRDITVSRSLEAMAGRLAFTSHEYRPDAINRPATVRIGPRVLWTGYVEQLHGEPRAGFSYDGRSLTSNLVLVDAVGNELFRQSSIGTILRTLADRAGVAVGSVPAGQVPRFRLEKGKRLADQIQRLAEVRRFIATDDAQGQLVGYRAPDAPGTTWTDGQGTVTAAMRVDVDFSGWVNTWQCRGHRELVTDELGRDDAGQIGLDITTASLRPGLRVLPNNQTVSREDARNFVDWTAKRELARTVSVTVKHSTWVAEPGTRVRLRSSVLGIDEDFVVSSATFTAGESAVEYTAKCVLPDVYSFRPIKPRAEKRVSGWIIARGPVEVVQ